MKNLIGVAIFTFLVGCATPAQRFDKMATKLDYSRRELSSTDFRHVAYLNKTARNTRFLHVYLEGDGTPWLTSTRVSADPTPRNPVMLKLMSLDPNPSILLGRPCYHGTARDAPCHPLLWTHQRYSEYVVASMAEALNVYLLKQGVEHVMLFGFSGGGTLAMLLAERIPKTRAVVTLAGNLDIDAWTRHHGYTPLHGSLNPVTQHPLRANILQLHYTSTNDQVVPPALVKKAIATQASAHLIVVNDADHACCWATIWQSVLARMPH